MRTGATLALNPCAGARSARPDYNHSTLARLPDPPRPIEAREDSMTTRAGKHEQPAPRPTGARTVDPRSILAREVMRTDLLALSTEDSIETAVEQLEEYGVSGAPVVDGAGRPVGVLSISDIARRDHVRSGHVSSEREGDLPDSLGEDGDDAFGAELSARNDYSAELLGRVKVHEWMTPGVLHVGPDATLATVCRLMIDASVHRVFVVEGQRLSGIISTHDVVRLLAD